MSNTADTNGSPVQTVTGTLNLLNSRWTLHIVATLLDGPRRFNEIARTYNINPRTLTMRLRTLEEVGVVERQVVSQTPPNVTYRLTDKGLALSHIFMAMEDWSHRWMPESNHHAAKLSSRNRSTAPQ